jgi:hypothetical protein
MTTYILFEHTNDPYGRKAVQVHDDRWEAEAAQLVLQQDKATEYNKARARAYRAGQGFSAQRTAAHYVNDYSIQEVQQ